MYKSIHNNKKKKEKKIAANRRLSKWTENDRVPMAVKKVSLGKTKTLDV